MLETTVRDFQNNWTGTGTIENAGVADTERLALTAGQNMVSETVYTGATTTSVLTNVYAAGDSVTVSYRHGASQADCEAADWVPYTVPFVSLGYVQVKVEVPA